MSAPLKVAVIAGESSGDLLGADLVAALKAESGRAVELVGVGGPALAEQGLTSLFDFTEIAIMGFVAVVKKLPRLLGLIRRTADAIVTARPDVLVIIDSPVFTQDVLHPFVGGRQRRRFGHALELGHRRQLLVQLIQPCWL